MAGEVEGLRDDDDKDEGMTKKSEEVADGQLTAFFLEAFRENWLPTTLDLQNGVGGD